MSTFTSLLRKPDVSNLAPAWKATSRRTRGGAALGLLHARVSSNEPAQTIPGQAPWVALLSHLGDREHVPVQAKLEVSAPGDPLEKEADRVADSVMRMPLDQGAQNQSEELDLSLQSSAGVVQRACASCASAQNDDEKQVQRSPDAAAKRDAVATPGWSQRLSAARPGGEPLPGTLRRFMEPRFGASFGDVKLHHDETADSLNQDIHARAFTVGRDVFFKPQEFAPSTERGQRLIAHELAHVLQQSEPGMVQRRAEAAEEQPKGTGQEQGGPKRLKSPKFSGDHVLEMTLNNLITLKSGKESPSINHAVRLVQEALVKLGYALPKYGADGRFGNETEGAVARYQEDYGLKVDGRVGPETLGDLDDKMAAGAKPNIPPEPACFTLPDNTSSGLLAELEQIGYTVAPTAASGAATADAQAPEKVPGRLVCWPYKYGVNVQECGSNQGVIDEAHKDAAKLANSAINAIGHRMDASSNVPFALTNYFGKDAMSLFADIEAMYYRILGALGQHYMYHCAYADEKRRQMFLGRCTTGVWAETSQSDPHDISVCVPNFVDKCDNFVRAAVLIHESVHRLGVFDEGVGHAKRFRSECSFDGSAAALDTRSLLKNCDSYAAFAQWASKTGY